MSYYKTRLGKKVVGTSDTSDSYTYGRTYKDWASVKTKDTDSEELADTYLHFYDTDTQPQVIDYDNIKNYFKLNKSVARATLDYFSNPEQRIDSVPQPDYNFRALDYDIKLKPNNTRGGNYISLLQESNANFDREYNLYNVRLADMTYGDHGEYTEDTTQTNPLMNQNHFADGTSREAALEPQYVDVTVQTST